MLRFVVFRLLQSLVALAILSVVVFILARATGDPLHMILPMNASEEDYANARQYLGLDRPYVEQYLSFVGRAVIGDFGNSIRARRPVIELLQARLPYSLKLAAFAMVVSLGLAFPLGVMAAVHKGTGVDRAAQIVAILGQSLPTFWVSIVLVEFVAGRLQWLPAGGADSSEIPNGSSRFSKVGRRDAGAPRTGSGSRRRRLAGIATIPNRGLLFTDSAAPPPRATPRSCAREHARSPAPTPSTSSRPCGSSAAP